MEVVMRLFRDRNINENNFRLDLAEEMVHNLGIILGDNLMFSFASGKSEAERINVLPKI